MLSYNDIKYIRFTDIKIKISDNKIITIPPLTVFQEAQILTLSKDLEPSEEILHEEKPDKIKRVKEIVDITIGNQEIKELKDVILVYSIIWSGIIIPLIQFIIDEDIQEFLNLNKKQDDEDKPEDKDIDEKDIDVIHKFPLFHLVSYVLSKQHIPEQYLKYLGLRYFIWAFRYHKREEELQRIQDINLLYETAHFAGIMGNPNIDSKSIRKYRPFDNILKSLFKDLNINEKEIKKAECVGTNITAIIEKMEKEGKAFTNKDYYEKFISKKNTKD